MLPYPGPGEPLPWAAPPQPPPNRFRTDAGIGVGLGIAVPVLLWFGGPMGFLSGLGLPLFGAPLLLLLLAVPVVAFALKRPGIAVGFLSTVGVMVLVFLVTCFAIFSQV